MQASLGTTAAWWDDDDEDMEDEKEAGNSIFKSISSFIVGNPLMMRLLNPDNAYERYDHRSTWEELQERWPPGPAWNSQFRFTLE